MPGKLPVTVVLILSLLASGAARWLTGITRDGIAPEADQVVAGESRAEALGGLDSFALALLLGGLRGPLVMALWTSSESQKTSRDLEDLDTKIELIRLLQPQFNTVHLYQIWNKAYNVSADTTSLAGKYAAVLDAVDYANKVLADRPENVDIETQLGEIDNNKLGGSQEGDYYTRRVREETRADEPQTRVTFPVGLDGEFRGAALRAGISPRTLNVQRSQRPGYLVAGVRKSAGDRLRQTFAGDGIDYADLPPRPVRARGVGGPLRFEPMLDADGRLLDALTTPRRPAPPGAEPGTYLDGSPLQFLRGRGPFPSGLPPQALAYNHFMKARVLQDYAGQRHAQKSTDYVEANPARALRDWSLGAFEEGRLLEAEALGREPVPPGESGPLQADLERLVADVPVNGRGEVVSPDLMRRAVQQYDRSLGVGREAIDALTAHLRQYPDATATFGATIARLDAIRPMLEADVLYDRLLLNDFPDAAARAEAVKAAIPLYTAAYGELRDYVLRYHVAPRVLPEGVSEAGVLGQSFGVKEQVIAALRVAAANPDFEHARAVAEFGGYLDRIAARLARLRAVGSVGAAGTG